jgi:hypothetical protein
MVMAVNDRISGLNIGVAVKPACYVVTTANITLSGEQTIDGISVGSNSERVLVANQTDESENGIYVADSAAWSRASDCDGSKDIIPGTFVRVNRGSVYSGSLWVFNTSSTQGSLTVGTDDLTLSLSSVELSGVSSWVQDNFLGVTSASSARSAIGAISSTFPAFPSTYIEGAVFPITSWSSFQSYLDPIDRFGMVGDGVTNDTTRFTSLESTWANRRVDLRGNTYLVDSVPIGNRYYNGYFKVSTGGDGFPARYPTPETLTRSIVTIESGSRMSYSGAAGILAKYNDVYIIRYNEGLTDSATDGTGVIGLSYDEGRSWQGIHTIKPISTGWNVLNLGVIDGQVMTVVRDNGSTDTHTLYGMRMWQRREDASILVSVTSGSNSFAIKFSTAQGFAIGGGVITGDVIKIDNLSSDVAGVTLGTTYAITAVGLAAFIQASATANATLDDSPRTCDVEFKHQGWVVKDVNSTDIGEAIRLAASATEPPGAMVGKLVPVQGDRGTFYCSAALIYPNNYTHAIAKVRYGLSDQSSVQFVRHIYGATAGSEADFVRDSSGKFFGWLRTNNSASYPMRFFYSPDDNFDSTNTILTDYDYPMLDDVQPACVLVNDNTIWTAMSGSRVPSTSTAAKTNLYFGTQRTTDAIVHGATGFEWTWLTYLHYDPNADEGDLNSPIGQCGIVDISTSKALIGYTDMSPSVRPGWPNLAAGFEWSGQSNMRVMTLCFSATDDLIEHIVHQTTNTINVKSTYLG